MKNQLFFETISDDMKQLLFQLMAVPVLANFHLVGGTALALMKGHRKSVDIDLFTAEPFDCKTITEEFERESFNYQLVSLSKYGLTYVIDDIKIDIYFWNELLLNPIQEIEGIRVISDDDILAMKLEAILSRREKKDYIDIAELLTEYTLEWGINCHQNKYKNKDKNLIINALNCIEEATNTLMPILLKGQTWENARATIEQSVAEFVWLEKQRIKQKRQVHRK